MPHIAKNHHRFPLGLSRREALQSLAIGLAGAATFKPFIDHKTRCARDARRQFLLAFNGMALIHQFTGSLGVSATHFAAHYKMIESARQEEQVR